MNGEKGLSSLVTVRVRDPRSCPDCVIESIILLNMMGYEGCPAQRTCSVIIPHDPTVKAAPVEDVAAIHEASDLVLSFKVVEADRAALRRRAAAVHLLLQLRELCHRQDFFDEQGGHRLELRHPLRPRNVRVETQVAEEDCHEFPYETQHGNELHNQLWQNKLCVTNWKSHDEFVDDAFQVSMLLWG